MMKWSAGFSWRVTFPRACGMKKILLLEDIEERITAFRAAVAKLPGVEMTVWRRAGSMIRDLPDHLPTASVISLDHDLLPPKGVRDSPGTGLEVCEALAKLKPGCPVLLHTANHIKVWPMMNELTFSKWDVHRTPPVRMDESWIETVWLPRIRKLLNHTPSDSKPTHRLPIKNES
jgi:hypothetical protein